MITNFVIFITYSCIINLKFKINKELAGQRYERRTILCSRHFLITYSSIINLKYTMEDFNSICWPDMCNTDCDVFE